MEDEEGGEVRLSPLEEVAEKEGEGPRQGQEDDDEDIRERGGEIGAQLAAHDGQHGSCLRLAAWS
jgi:hypothetical protein